MNIDKFFTLAKNASTFSDFERIKIGSVLVYKNKVISVGWNMKKSHPYQKILNKYGKYNQDKIHNYLHSEINCLLNIKDLNVNWIKVSIFIYREDKNGNLAMCKPCSSCIKALKEKGVKKIFYTDQNGYNYIEI